MNQNVSSSLQNVAEPWVSCTKCTKCNGPWSVGCLDWGWNYILETAKSLICQHSNSPFEKLKWSFKNPIQRRSKGLFPQGAGAALSARSFQHHPAFANDMFRAWRNIAWIKIHENSGDPKTGLRREGQSGEEKRNHWRKLNTNIFYL